jgi:hypothetical protein
LRNVRLCPLKLVLRRRSVVTLCGDRRLPYEIGTTFPHAVSGFWLAVNGFWWTL